MIQDSGKRREFKSGAIRDIDEDKGRCDLLPLDVIGEHLHNSILIDINQYMRIGNPQFLYKAIDTFIFDERKINWWDALLEVAIHYSEGAKKYEDRNWEQGIPLHCFIDSGVRHYIKYLRGDTDERHDRAFIWNMLGAIYTHRKMPEMIDLPFADK